MTKDSFLYVVVFTFLVAFVFVFLIALVDEATSERVLLNRERATAEAFLNAVGIPLEGDVRELYKSSFGQPNSDGIVTTTVDGRRVVARQFTGNGLWGAVSGVLALDPEENMIVGLDIISHSETPGLGGRIEEDWFKEQFRGELIPPDGLRVMKGEGGMDMDQGNGMVDGVTGASLTSAAMETIVNDEIDMLMKGADDE
ncbi:MAG: FMN-binding protein [Spirochaetales bacterium]|nr:FMN-binding protein [Spirochaetales bacterium]